MKCVLNSLLESRTDLQDSATLTDLNLLKAKLKELESNPDAQLTSFEINGYASPEGNYERNKSWLQSV